MSHDASSFAAGSKEQRPVRGGLLAVLERFTRCAALVWTVVAIMVVSSIVGPLTAGAGVAGTLVLRVLHVVPAAVLVPVVRRLGLEPRTH